MITTEQSMLLTIPEIRLSLKLLGYEKWNDLPLIETDESVEQRIMNAFLKLIQSGYFEEYDGGYRMTEDFRKKMIWIGQADQVYHLWDEERIAVFVYEKEGEILLISPDFGKRDGCKITNLGACLPENIINEISDFENRRDYLELKRAEADKEEIGAEKLIYFLGAAKVMEEAE